MVKRNERCCICGEYITGKMKVTARKGTEYLFCTFHFNYYIEKNMKQMREIIKRNKYAVTK